MNLYTIIGSIAFWLVSVVGVGIWQHNAGAISQQVTDQAQFDKINSDLAAQKAEANSKLQAALTSNLQLQQKSEQDKKDFQDERDKASVTINTLRKQYATAKLQFAVPEGTGCGNSSSGAAGSGSSPSTAGTNYIQLPDKIATDLRELMVEGDELAANYKMCYQWVNRKK